MAIKNKPTRLTGTPDYDRLRRKADQEWDMAGLARQDRDTADEERHTAKAREYENQIKELFHD